MPEMSDFSYVYLALVNNYYRYKDTASNAIMLEISDGPVGKNKTRRA